MIRYVPETQAYVDSFDAPILRGRDPAEAHRMHVNASKIITDGSVPLATCRQIDVIAAHQAQEEAERAQASAQAEATMPKSTYCQHYAVTGATYCW